MSKIADTMEEMMAGMMKPEDMPVMMNAMMDRMFSTMTVQDRTEFISTMMPRCLNLVMAGMSAEDRKTLANQLVDELVVTALRADVQK